jgi:hypothetical protein
MVAGVIRGGARRSRSRMRTGTDQIGAHGARRCIYRSIAHGQRATKERLSSFSRAVGSCSGKEF